MDWQTPVGQNVIGIIKISIMKIENRKKKNLEKKYHEESTSLKSIQSVEKNMSDASDNRLVSATIVEIELESILRQ